VALPAVTAASVWFGGYRAGILTAALGYVACDYLFTDGVGFGPYTSVDLIRLLAVALSTTSSSCLASARGSSPRQTAGTRG
jgi:hypothetical protein